jgi:hypothetical protein
VQPPTAAPAATPETKLTAAQRMALGLYYKTQPTPAEGAEPPNASSA